jgi:hypothetical protein
MQQLPALSIEALNVAIAKVCLRQMPPRKIARSGLAAAGCTYLCASVAVSAES